ncbi:hypothetical protein B0H12DRAFT_369443 [Mycena haematopus]|nr:hypothetical protein B0H12DRAFT_369443 [Mycena haematopus]
MSAIYHSAGAQFSRSDPLMQRTALSSSCHPPPSRTQTSRATTGRREFRLPSSAPGAVRFIDNGCRAVEELAKDDPVEYERRGHAGRRAYHTSVLRERCSTCK